MKTVLTYGTFDLFHIGHLRLIQRARELGDQLYVGVSSDQFNAIKGKRSVMSYEQRSNIVQAIRYVDKVFPEHNWSQKESDIQDFNVNILVMGNDWLGKFDHLNVLCDVIYLPRTEGISTTELKAALSAFEGNKIEELQRSIKILQGIVSQLVA